MAARNEPIIIKRVEEDGGGDHHGGGWKVAYADFMTAMMAFFLLLWILAASDEEKLRGLADYFTPSLSEAGGRGDGMLDGEVLGPEGVMSGTDGPQSEVQLPSFGQENPLSVFDSRLREDSPPAVVEYEPAMEAAPGETPANDARAPAKNAAMAAAQEAREAELDAVEHQIAEAVAGRPELSDLLGHLRFDRTAEGLKVQILDHDGRSMFELGSAQIGDSTRDVLRIVGTAIADLPYPVEITGHTDSLPFTRRAGYSNWELSADRANATRRVLVDTGVSPARIARISGLADTAPLLPDQPEAAENRRIGILVHYPDPALIENEGAR
ncbi:OmpA family protein [Aquicoccus sp. SCR17]|nr:OmpA family protein [Carideicomes alvinocaridis]